VQDPPDYPYDPVVRCHPTRRFIGDLRLAAPNGSTQTARTLVGVSSCRWD
jgi:hypothetical protein